MDKCHRSVYKKVKDSVMQVSSWERLEGDTKNGLGHNTQNKAEWWMNSSLPQSRWSHSHWSIASISPTVNFLGEHFLVSFLCWVFLLFWWYLMKPITRLYFQYLSSILTHPPSLLPNYGEYYVFKVWGICLNVRNMLYLRYVKQKLLLKQNYELIDTMHYVLDRLSTL